ncbi:hypothetical protein ABPG77_009985 [Micractinium sp. CCAP 211/92]
MADTDLSETLADLLLKGAVPQRPQRLQGRYNLSSPLNYAGSGGAGGEAALAGLHSSLARELSVVDAMFQQWSQDAAAKRRAAVAARDFSDEHSFSLALLVMNKRGEVRRGTRTAQQYYFTPRQAAQHAGELPCARCCVHIQRRETYFVDRAVRSWHLGDEVCRPCMLCLMRSLLGEDDGAILAEAQGILDSAWRPTINPALAEALGGSTMLLAEL